MSDEPADRKPVMREPFRWLAYALAAIFFFLAGADVIAGGGAADLRGDLQLCGIGALWIALAHTRRR
jgi:hypothetical protein